MYTIATAVALCGTLVQHGAAQALTLGRIEVQSAQGEPLEAEIDISDITAEEIASLQVQLAPGEIFRSAGMALNPALSGMQISLQKRENGWPYLRLSTPGSVTDPFVEVIIEAQWSSGRLLRNYTLLLDPAKNAATTPFAPLAPALTQPPEARQPPTTTTARSGASEGAASTSVRVQYGDTARRIAVAHRPAEVSLDQMLVAMLRANPAAFVDGNVNRMKAGALLELPGTSEVQDIAPGEARQIIAAQSRDFNEFRRRLSAGAPVAAPQTDERQSSGQVQGAVQEERNAGTPADKLLLSKGAVAAKDAEEDTIAQQRQAKDTAARVAALSRNIEELAQLGAAAPDSPAGSAAANAPAPAEPLAGPALTTALPARPPESSLIATLVKEPLLVPVTGGLLALLAALGFLVNARRRQDKGDPQDSSFFQSRQEPVAHFETGSTGTFAVTPVTAVGTAPAFNSLDAQDVDPLTEADVYLAYGRDMQAEEILREALPGSPQRLAIILKLLEIHARRRDTDGFAALAQDAHGLTQGQGLQWSQVCDMGQALDASNPLYQSGGGAGPDTKAELDLDLNAGAQQPGAAATSDAVDFDFSFPPEMAAQIAASAHPPHRPPAQGGEQDEEPGDDIEHDDPPATAQTHPALAQQARASQVDWDALDLDIGSTKDKPDLGGAAGADDATRTGSARAGILLPQHDLPPPRPLHRS